MFIQKLVFANLFINYNSKYKKLKGVMYASFYFHSRIFIKKIFEPDDFCKRTYQKIW